MFIVGLKVDLDVMRSGQRAMAISLTSIALPFTLGFFLLGPMLHADNSCVAVEATVTVEPENLCTSAKVEEKQQQVEETAEAIRTQGAARACRGARSTSYRSPCSSA